MKELLGQDRYPLFVIAGPCVIESEDLCFSIATRMKEICAAVGAAYIFKASFDKANRSAGSSFRGPGLEEGLRILGKIRRELDVPVLTDVHEPQQAASVGQVCDVLQIPAFLARQTDLLVACGSTGKAVNIKKGQFMSPQEMANALAKVQSGGTDAVMFTERGTFFGYNRLVNDFTGLKVMKDIGRPVVFDVTHSTQQPAALGGSSGGNPQFSPLLARAAVAAGVDGLFLETHPNPKEALSDASTMLPLDTVEKLLRNCVEIARLRGNW